MRSARSIFLFAVIALAARDASAQDRAPARSQPSKAVRDGTTLPLGLPATRQHQLALMSAFSGYDTARDTALIEIQVVARIAGRLSIHGGAIYSDATDRMRPSAGGLFELLRQPGNGIDAAVGLTYRPEGLTEPEGEIEVALGVGRQIGDAATLLGNVTYGQDPEGNERDVELRAGGLVQVSERLLIGGDSRLRLALRRPDGSAEPDYDAIVGPVAVARFGRFAITGQAGASVVKGMTRSTGAIGLLGVSHVF